MDLEALRESANGLAASDEELILLALFGSEAERLLRSIRLRAGGEETAFGRRPGARAEDPRTSCGSSRSPTIDEITVEEDGMRVRVRRTSAPGGVGVRVAAPARRGRLPPCRRPRPALYRIESPMVGTFYRGPQPGAPPLVEEGDPVGPGRRSSSSRR